MACVHDEYGVRLLMVDRERLAPAVKAQWIRSTDKRYFVKPDEFDAYEDALEAFRRAERELLETGMEPLSGQGGYL